MFFQTQNLVFISTMFFLFFSKAVCHGFWLWTCTATEYSIILNSSVLPTVATVSRRSFPVST